MAIELPDVTEVEAAAANWRDSQPRFRALLERYGNLPQALRHFGLLLWEKGLTQDAANVLIGAVALTPQDAALWSDLSGALHAGDRLADAAYCMAESLLRDHAQALSWLRLGTLRATLGEVEGAEQAYKTALALDANLADARLSLGLFYFGLKRFPEAAQHLKIALAETATPNPQVQACYGQALAHAGDFAEAAEALLRAARLDPENRVVMEKAAQARFIADLIAGASPEDASLGCLAWPGMTGKDAAKISRQAFHLLSAYGHTQAALGLGEARLTSEPDDPELNYILSILRGEPVTRAPDHYVASHFDQFAEQFDKQLTGVLGYSAFKPLAALAESHAGPLARVLDLGCGTGLAGPFLAKPGRHVIGVDLSARMLEKARAGGCYDSLLNAEAVAYLATQTASFDLIFAADVLIYVGELGDLLRNAAQALVAGGLFAFTIETNTGADIALMPSGRFAHALDYVLAQATEADFTTVATHEIQLRYETTGFVTGHLILLRRV
ncbi:MAG: methyltransferase domain-containing protein [Beijerinckiaceae bacterium]|nr:methyltransferase domain-containing protein [Beijerinckiaceae bacterium]